MATGSASQSINLTELASVVYFHTPCELCRRNAVRLLHNRKDAPAWLLKESRQDAFDDIRSLVQSSTS